MGIRDEDYVYVIVQRSINGTPRRYLERMASRQVEDYRTEGLFLDSFLTYSGINESADTMTFSSSGGWGFADTITVTASAPTFTAADVGKGVTMWVPASPPIAIARITIVTYVSGTVVSGLPSTVFPEDEVPVVPELLRATPTAFWSIAVGKVGGLAHLASSDVGILANGVALTGIVVEEGADWVVDLGGNLYDVVHVGLPIEADFETLDLDAGGPSNVRDKAKLVRAASLLVDKSRGIMVGPDGAHLAEVPPEAGAVLETDIFDTTSGLVRSEIVEAPIDATWGRPGRVFVRQSEPYPLAILGVIPEGKIGG